MNVIPNVVNLEEPARFDKEDYMSEYFEFMEKYKIAEISAEEVGQAMARLAQYFAIFNLRLTGAERRLAGVAQDIECRTDDNGKNISSTKAKVFVEATPEAERVEILKTHLENIETFLSSLRSLQKGLLQEFLAMSHT